MTKKHFALRRGERVKRVAVESGVGSQGKAGEARTLGKRRAELCEGGKQVKGERTQLERKRKCASLHGGCGQQRTENPKKDRALFLVGKKGTRRCFLKTGMAGIYHMVQAHKRARNVATAK